jgi:hypothetical protein
MRLLIGRHHATVQHPKQLKLAHMTWEHIFQAISISFSDSYLVHEMSLRQKGTYAPPQDKARGLNIHDGK